MDEYMAKLQKTDHDTLIRLESKVDGLVTDVRDMKDGFNIKLAEHETRLRFIEKMVDTTQPEVALKQLSVNTKWIEDFQVQWRTVRAIWIGVTAILGTLLTIIAIKSNLFGR